MFRFVVIKSNIFMSTSLGFSTFCHAIVFITIVGSVFRRIVSSVQIKDTPSFGKFNKTCSIVGGDAMEIFSMESVVVKKLEALILITLSTCFTQSSSSFVEQQGQQPNVCAIKFCISGRVQQNNTLATPWR
eukprot:Lithocolla_globosa_v1_NODE_4982_length_1324_cov_17.463357.p2 type:complete len:131 gc:universal NODE_4982_length_1324_cov_17.463357:1169-777(-)